ncbi:MAG TPA: hypothetical protein VFV07_07825 [Rhizomicrobium sp.]|nr:hypothetical protein [Rhizomicrobium sp.]
MSKSRIPILAFTLLALCACTSNPAPEDYDGPIATVADTAAKESSGGVDFFFVEKIDGRKVRTSLAATAQANDGMGFSMRPVLLDHAAPAEAAVTVTITGRTHYAAPILEMTNTVYQVSGEVTFTPVRNRVYDVKGVLRENHSAVWIEDNVTGAVVGKKIEIKGSAALGFFSK